MRRSAASTVISLAVTVTVVVTLAPPGAQAQTLDEAIAEASAPELVADEGDEYTLVYENSDGTRTAKIHSVPQRVERDGAWVTPDATLVEVSPGVWSPRAVVTEVSFGSGDLPVVTITEDDVSLGLSWAPVPLVAGPRATYEEVLPGVDLVLTAGLDGFQQALVIKDRAAGQQDALSRVAFDWSVVGGELRENADKSLSVMAGGVEVMTSPAPTMWDAGEASSGLVQSQVPTVADAVEPLLGGPEGEDVGVGLQLEVTADQVVISPNPDYLADPGTEYPVVLDPPFSAGRRAWYMVNQRFPTTAYHNWGGADEGMGYVVQGGAQHKRLFWDFDVAFLAGKGILSATFAAAATDAYSCTPSEVELRIVGPMPGSTTWNNQPAFGRELDWKSVSYGRAGCPAGGNVDPNDRWLEMNATSAVVEAAGNGWGNLNLALKADDVDTNAGNQNSWKRFRSDAVLNVTYNSLPSVGPNPEVPTGAVCDNDGVNEPYSASLEPPIRYHINDPDGGIQNVKSVVSVWVPGGSAPLWRWESGEFGSGVWQGGTIRGIPGDGRYSVLIESRDAMNAVGDSRWCNVIVDTTKPRPPTTSSTSYPSDRWAGSGTAPGAFTFGVNGETDVAKFRYSLDNDATNLEAMPRSVS